jgi:hypothetical protein
MSAVTHIERVLMGHFISLPAYILSDLAQIVDAARREGAEQMREAIAHQAEINALYGVHGTTVSTIRSRPLPAGPRQAVRLSHAEIAEAFLSRCPAHLRSDHDVRDIITANWAAMEQRAAEQEEVGRLKADAEAYQLLRRGQHWSVIDGVGQTLRGEELDAAVAAVKGRT